MICALLVFAHYGDLSADLEQEMCHLAARLGIAVPEPTWPQLVEAATFQQCGRGPTRWLQPDQAFSKTLTLSFVRERQVQVGSCSPTQSSAATVRAQHISPHRICWLGSTGRATQAHERDTC